MPFKKGHKIRLGHHHSEETKEKLRLAHSGENGSNWLGNEVSDIGARKRIYMPGRPNYIPVPEGYIRHHIDGNPKNNVPNNIAIITQKEHMTLHAKLWKKAKGDTPEIKHCIICHKGKPRSAFSKERKSIDGLQSRCKDCRNQHRRQLYAQRRTK